MAKLLCIRYSQYLFIYIYYYSIIFTYSNILSTTSYNIPATGTDNNSSLSETVPSERYGTVITDIRAQVSQSSKSYKERAKEIE